MKILWANCYCLLDTSSGASITCREILRNLAHRGYEVRVLGATVFDSEKGLKALGGQKNAVLRGDSDVVTVKDGDLAHELLRTKATSPSHLTERECGKFFAYVRKVLDEFSPDVVMYYGGQPLDMLLTYEARIRGIPVVAYLANGNYTGRRWCQDVDLVLTDSQATAELYKNSIGIEAIPIGKFIDPQRFVVERRSPQNVTFINPSIEKGAGIVAMMAIQLEERRPDIIFEVVDSRGDWPSIRGTIQNALGLPKRSLRNVTITNNTTDMRVVYGRSRLLVAPSLWWESSGRVLAEAMLNAIPVIITDRGGMPEMIENAGLLLTLPAKCYEAPYQELPNPNALSPLVERIEELFDDEDIYYAYCAEARQVGLRRHDLNKNMDFLERVLEPLFQREAGKLDHQNLINQWHRHPTS